MEHGTRYFLYYSSPFANQSISRIRQLISFLILSSINWVLHVNLSHVSCNTFKLILIMLNAEHPSEDGGGKFIISKKFHHLSICDVSWELSIMMKFSFLTKAFIVSAADCIVQRVVKWKLNIDKVVVSQKNRRWTRNCDDNIIENQIKESIIRKFQIFDSPQHSALQRELESFPYHHPSLDLNLVSRLYSIDRIHFIQFSNYTMVTKYHNS